MAKALEHVMEGAEVHALLAAQTGVLKSFGEPPQMLFEGLSDEFDEADRLRLLLRCLPQLSDPPKGYLLRRVQEIFSHDVEQLRQDIRTELDSPDLERRLGFMELDKWRNAIGAS